MCYPQSHLRPCHLYRLRRRHLERKVGPVYRLILEYHSIGTPQGGCQDLWLRSKLRLVQLGRLSCAHLRSQAYRKLLGAYRHRT